MTFRDLRAEEIECRVQSISSKGDVCKGLQLLLYKDSRTDATILDETVGAGNWARKHYECKGNLYCSVGINVNWDKPDKEEKWVWKDDCGIESNMEKEKGEASDAFKRTMSINWGLGRELYTKIFIWVDAKDFKYWDTQQKDKYGNSIFKTNDKFAVADVKIKNKKIVGLTIVNTSTKKEVFTLFPAEKPSKTHIDALKATAKTKGVSEDKICKKYGLEKIEDISMVQYAECATGLNKMPDVNKSEIYESVN